MNQTFISSGLTGLLLLAAPAISDTYIENNGFVSFEAEAGEVTGNWSSATDLGHFSGDSYIIWDGPDLFNSSLAGSDPIVYQFEITTPGNYELRWRSRIGKGDNNTESNDSWVRFPSGVNVNGEQPLLGWSKIHMSHTGAWFWDARVNDHAGASVRQYFPAGLHTMEVSGRSNGHAIDKIALYKYDSLSLSPSDLDTLSGTPQASVDGNDATIDGTAPNIVKVIASGLSTTPGECSDNTLTLSPVADIHSIAGSVANQIALSFSPQPAKGLLRFDLSGVTGIYSAALELAIDSGAGAATVEVNRLSATDWLENQDALSPEPENLLQLSSVSRQWEVGKRYALSLPAQDLPSGLLDISIASLSSDLVLSMASRENSQHMPLMVLKGNADFCSNYLAALEALNHEASEIGSNEDSGDSEQSMQTSEVSADQQSTEPTSEPPTTPTTQTTTDSTANPADNTTLQANSTSGSVQEKSNGGSIGVLALFTLLAWAGIRRQKTGRVQRSPYGQ